MAAIALHPSSRHRRSTTAHRALRPPRPPARHLPSVAVRRRRAAVAFAAVAALGTLLGAGSLAGAGQDPADRRGARLEATPIAATVHVVQPGDTLWTLARRLQPDGDVRPLVARLQAARGPGPLVPGERLSLAV